MTDRSVAVVTGAGRGIGRAIALQLTKSGFAVVGSARTKTDLESLDEEIAKVGGISTTVVADSTTREGAKAPVEVAIEQFGRIDVLVNNVGGFIGTRTDSIDLSDDDFDATVAFTLSAAWWSITAALPTMRAQKKGAIVNIGSASARFGLGTIGYAAAKHGIAGMTKALAVAAADYGITVNCVSPGFTNTPRVKSSWPQRAKALGVTEDEAKAATLGEVAQHRILEPEEIARVVAFLASAEAKGMTGQDLAIDGGFRI